MKNLMIALLSLVMILGGVSYATAAHRPVLKAARAVVTRVANVRPLRVFKVVKVRPFRGLFRGC